VLLIISLFRAIAEGWWTRKKRGDCKSHFKFLSK